MCRGFNRPVKPSFPDEYAAPRLSGTRMLWPLTAKANHRLCPQVSERQRGSADHRTGNHSNILALLLYMEGFSEFLMLMCILSEENIFCSISQICLNKKPISIFRASGRTRVPHFGKSRLRTSLHSLNWETTFCELINKYLRVVWSKK